MLKKIADKKNLITVVLAGILLVLWLLYLLFGGGEQKIAMLVLTPVLAVVFYGFLRLILKVVGKAASPKTMSAFIGFFLIAGTLGFLLMLLEYIGGFPNGLTASLGGCAGVLAAALAESDQL
ncbi:MAG: hypothetical protein IJB88_01945 [Clostridia bacterium]|nr:hypothetical protein [Clostridia bacterium]